MIRKDGRQKPEIKDWVFLFKFKHGYDNREEVVKSFLDFLADPHQNMWTSPGHFALGGLIYGREPFFQDGGLVITSQVQVIEKLDAKYSFGVEEFSFKVTTDSETEYLIRTTEKSPYMFLLMGDYFHLGILSKMADRYNPPEFRAKGLL